MDDPLSLLPPGIWRTDCIISFELIGRSFNMKISKRLKQSRETAQSLMKYTNYLNNRPTSCSTSRLQVYHTHSQMKHLSHESKHCHCYVIPHFNTVISYSILLLGRYFSSFGSRWIRSDQLTYAVEEKKYFAMHRDTTFHLDDKAVWITTTSRSYQLFVCLKAPRRYRRCRYSPY